MAKVEMEKVKYSNWHVDTCDYEYFSCDNCLNSVWNGADSRREAEEMLDKGECLPCCPFCRAIMKNSNEKPEDLNIIEVIEVQ